MINMLKIIKYTNDYTLCMHNNDFRKPCEGGHSILSRPYGAQYIWSTQMFIE